ncbi:hypothetical protein LUX32_48470 [Actinomadura madurae]|nr:hypothetical protein [Actinomadura madurae]MCP9984511.1 hypothetical protein [Actinomadura madurae]MCQ0003937.1 hypothetical protein [Actinomadura madurae]
MAATTRASSGCVIPRCSAAADTARAWSAPKTVTYAGRRASTSRMAPTGSWTRWPTLPSPAPASWIARAPRRSMAAASGRCSATVRITCGLRPTCLNTGHSRTSWAAATAASAAALAATASRSIR